MGTEIRVDEDMVTGEVTAIHDKRVTIDAYDETVVITVGDEHDWAYETAVITRDDFEALGEVLRILDSLNVGPYDDI